MGRSRAVGPALTTAQRKLLRIVYGYAKALGTSPTLRELCADLGTTSTNGVSQTLDVLERKGCIERRAGFRGLRLTDAGELAALGHDIVQPWELSAEEYVDTYVEVWRDIATEAGHGARFEAELEPAVRVELAARHARVCAQAKMAGGQP